MSVETPFGSYPDAFAKYLRPTNMCNFDYGPVKKVSNTVVSDCSTDYQAITAVHEFVAAFPIGFDREDSSASYILRKQRGQCNTKTTLFVALLRCAGVPARIHAYRVDKAVHKPNFPWLVYAFTPSSTLFTYPEVFYKGKWQLLSQALYSRTKPDWEMCPFDDARGRKHPLKQSWIVEDLGSFWHPDTFYSAFGTNADGWRKFAFPLAQWLLNK